MNPINSVPDAKIKQAISSVNEKEKRKANVLINMQSSDEDKSYDISHNSIKLQDKNIESLEVSSKSEEFEK